MLMVLVPDSKAAQKRRAKMKADEEEKAVEKLDNAETQAFLLEFVRRVRERAEQLCGCCGSVSGAFLKCSGCVRKCRVCFGMRFRSQRNAARLCLGCFGAFLGCSPFLERALRMKACLAAQKVQTEKASDRIWKMIQRSSGVLLEKRFAAEEWLSGTSEGLPVFEVCVALCRR